MYCLLRSMWHAPREPERVPKSSSTAILFQTALSVQGEQGCNHGVRKTNKLVIPQLQVLLLLGSLSHTKALLAGASGSSPMRKGWFAAGTPAEVKRPGLQAELVLSGILRIGTVCC